MGKIALVTKGFTGSLFPLAKQLIRKGYDVDIYLFNYILFSDLEAFKCSYKSNRYGIEAIQVCEWQEMYSYLRGMGRVRLFSLKMPRPYNNIPVLRDLISLYSQGYIKQSCLFINNQNYNFINIIGGYYSREYLPFMKLITSKLVFSLHEVCDHFKPDFKKPPMLLTYLFRNSIDIIIYSDNSYRDILRYDEVIKEKIHRINFGLFNTYLTIPKKYCLSLPDKYFLFFGSILPYKGLSILNDAIKLISNELKDYKLVVAGKGYDSCIDEMKDNPNVVLINKRLSNSELCQVIENSRFVICPYITMSQSGIPQTIFVFNKPIIASNLDGFKEIVKHNNNGLLFERGSSAKLAACIIKFITDKELYNSCNINVKMFETYYSSFSWNNIANKYIENFL